MTNCHVCMRQALMLEGQALAAKQEREDLHRWKDKEKVDRRIEILRSDAQGWREEAARCSGKH